jgi:hypothetical protein
VHKLDVFRKCCKRRRFKKLDRQQQQLLDDQDDDYYDETEYAKETNAIDCDSLGLVYYADEAGVVSSQKNDLPPEWGIDLRFTNASIQYGGWADRQKCALIMDEFY